MRRKSVGNLESWTEEKQQGGEAGVEMWRAFAAG